jgi:predicted transcriptional regulator
MVIEGKGDCTLSSVLAGGQIPFVHRDQPLDWALRYLDRWPLVPVVGRDDFRKLEGVISRDDVLKCYREFGER